MILNRNRRPGLSLPEILVALGVVGLLLSLLLPAIQRARESAASTACKSNMRQIAIALHLYHNDHGRFPRPMVRPSPGTADELLGWMALLLPYVEKGDLWLQAQEACALEPDPWRSPPHTALGSVVKLYICPTDGRLTSALLDADGILAAHASYIGVAGGRRLDGVFHGQFRGVSLADIFDGPANTLLLAERPPPDTLQAGKWYSMYWFAGVYGTTYGPNGAMLASGAAFPGDTCGGAFQFGPGRTDNPCDRYHFWSLHPGGGNYAFADSSVRFLRYGSPSVIEELATRAGGEHIELE